MHWSRGQEIQLPLGIGQYLYFHVTLVSSILLSPSLCVPALQSAPTLLCTPTLTASQLIRIPEVWLLISETAMSTSQSKHATALTQTQNIYSMESGFQNKPHIST